ncbi:hypothetical protein J6590_098100, partial [Homalodisca vitripennis]
NVYGMTGVLWCDMMVPGLILFSEHARNETGPVHIIQHYCGLDMTLLGSFGQIRA